MTLLRLIPLALAPSIAFAQVSVNGSIAGDAYCSSTIQTVDTQFGDNESELNGGYGAILGGRLHLALTGNIQANFNKIEIFIDSRAGGENVLSGMPGNDGSAAMAGLTFDAGFEPDYHLIFRRGISGSGPVCDIDFAELGTANFNIYPDLFAGQLEGLASTGTGLNVQPIVVAYSDANAGGVIDGCSPADATAAAAVRSGLELSIALADLGMPAGSVRVCAFINNDAHNFASNQFLGGLQGPQCNLGGDGAGNFTGGLNFDLNTFAGDQFFEVERCQAPRPIFGVDVRGDRFFTSDTLSFVDNFRSIGTFAAAAFALDCSADGTTVWAVVGDQYGTIDILDGTFVALGTLVGPTSANGLTAAVDGTTWYIAQASDIWVGDITTGTFTLLGNTGLAETLIDISIDATNRLYGMSITTDTLVSIDTATGVGTVIGATGLATNFAQGMDFDWSTGELYATLYTGGGTGAFATLDLATGAALIREDTLPLNAEMEIAVRVPAGVVSPFICTGTPNSTGLGGRLEVAGSSTAANNDILLTVANLPQNSMGYFLNSPDAPFTVLNPGGAEGDLCIASFSQGRHSMDILNAGAGGIVALQIDLNQVPQPTGPTTIMAGTSWSWQYWYRDMNGAGMTTSNFSSARRVVFF